MRLETVTVLFILEVDAYSARISSIFIEDCVILMLKAVSLREILRLVTDVNQGTNYNSVFVLHKLLN